MWYLFTDLGPEPSAEECEAVDNKMLGYIEWDWGKEFAGRYRKVNFLDLTPETSIDFHQTQTN